jgi:hypothetical protein
VIIPREKEITNWIRNFGATKQRKKISEEWSKVGTRSKKIHKFCIESAINGGFDLNRI